MAEFTIKAEDFFVGNPEAPDNTLWGVVKQIMDLDRGAPDFKKRMRAIIKRHSHLEKLDMYQKFGTWLEYHSLPFVKDNLVPIKIETHKEWAAKNDDDIWTSGE